MTLTFDIAEDELHIYIAETDEHIQTLDEGFVQLEREGDDPELLQSIFRAAHTLKGSAGMIGHKRMAELTHALEAVLDGLRKHTVAVSAPLVDACLSALDALKLLRNEVIDGQPNPIDVQSIVASLLALQKSASPAPAVSSPPPAESVLTLPALYSKNSPPQNGKKPEAKSNGHRQANGKQPVKKTKGRAASKKRPATRKSKPVAKPAPVAQKDDPGHSIMVSADIAADSVASAARAFQVLLALQSLGEVADLQPPQWVIESAAPVRTLTARLITEQPRDAVQKALSLISEVERVVIDGQETNLLVGSPALSTSTTHSPGRLGEFLLEGGYISQDQLDAALAQQAGTNEPANTLGRNLVRMGAISQEVLDKAAIEHQVQRAAQPAAPERSKARQAEKTVRTSVERLDNLMNLVGELITDRNRLNQIRSDYEQTARGDENLENLSQTVVHVGRITDQLQEEVMRIRMQPIANVFNKFSRLVRDLARQANKQVDLIIRGEDTELDRTVIEEIGDPLIHLLRNAVDHGIESASDRAAAGKQARGTILLTARHEESHIILTVEDDGHGIDVERLKTKALHRGLITEAEAAAMPDDQAIELIFKPGLSTAKVVSDISGRGVGMDIVRTNIERLNGSVVVETWPGKGTRTQIVLPLTLAIVPALLVGVADSTYAIPLSAVMEALHIPASDIHTVNNHPVTQLRSRVLPLSRLRETLGLERPESSHTENVHHYIVAVQWARMELGLIVDRLIGEQELVIKSLGTLVGDVPGISGAAILGDGRVTLIVDVPGLFKLAGAGK